jgi:hypothetical protein
VAAGLAIPWPRASDLKAFNHRFKTDVGDLTGVLVSVGFYV